MTSRFSNRNRYGNGVACVWKGVDDKLGSLPLTDVDVVTARRQYAERDKYEE
ncbi:hypothetical protein [Segatella bryantii]|uniref:hypothetical protein n=1 Tax=Segatella bryantii TaxID=77095 RepID=UPI001FD48543|nr:hypothetical protein [Segatella bryantii]